MLIQDHMLVAKAVFLLLIIRFWLCHKMIKSFNFMSGGILLDFLNQLWLKYNHAKATFLWGFQVKRQCSLKGAKLKLNWWLSKIICRNMRVLTWDLQMKQWKHHCSSSEFVWVSARTYENVCFQMWQWLRCLFNESQVRCLFTMDEFFLSLTHTQTHTQSTTSSRFSGSSCCSCLYCCINPSNATPAWLSARRSGIQRREHSNTV